MVKIDILVETFLRFFAVAFVVAMNIKWSFGKESPDGIFDTVVMCGCVVACFIAGVLWVKIPPIIENYSKTTEVV